MSESFKSILDQLKKKKEPIKYKEINIEYKKPVAQQSHLIVLEISKL